MVTGYRVSPLRRRDIERKAADVRRGIDLDPHLPLPGVELFERIGRYSVELGRETIGLTYAVEEQLEGGALACARFEEDEGTISLSLSADSYEDLERGGGRARFSLAHEIGHAVLHADRLIHLTRIDHARRAMLRTDAKPTKVFCDSEWQADWFAAALLLPAPGLEYLLQAGRLTVAEIQRMYGVSKTCAERRLKNFLSNKRELLFGWN